MLLVTACALTGAVLIVAGKSSAAFIQVWVPPFALRDCAHLLMISACIAFAAGLVPASHTRALVRHPMLAGLVLAGIAHLLSNGDLASMLLFGVPTLWAALQLLVRGRQSRHSPSPPAMQWDTAAILLGMIAYGGLLVFHGPLFGFALTGPI
jgi:uncharacterized membrane protein